MTFFFNHKQPKFLVKQIINLVLFIFLFVFPDYGNAQISCNNWLNLPNQPSYVSIGDLDIPGNKVTVEAVFNRTTPWSGVDLYQGDIVSKHSGPNDCNYLLRPGSAEITTSNGYFKTPSICNIELNKTYHVAMVYDGSTLKFYRNGFLMSQTPATGNLYQNDWLTQIGLYYDRVFLTNFIGYVNEVRIWNIARTQDEIKSYMNQSLPSPQAASGLLAYYVFDNLTNKQGNAAWNGTLAGSASINKTNPNCSFVADSCGIIKTISLPSFTASDTVCVGEPVTIKNTSTGASNYYWNFCVADLNTAPTAVNLGNPGGLLASPVFIDYVFYNNNYYGFLVNHNPGKLVRLDFGNSLLNSPVAVDLGNFGGIIPPGAGAEGIQVVQNEGRWYAIIVGGYTPTGSTPRILKIDFGPVLTNISPVATNWGNLGNMWQPIDLHVFKEGNNWYGFTVNAENNTITRFNFTNSFNNSPTAVNLGNIGNLAYPTGIHAINDDGNWKVFIVNGGNTVTASALTRLDFGSSLLNTPTGVNLGNPGNILHHPRDLTIMKSCGQIFGFAVNGNTDYNDIVKMDFNNNLSSTPVITSLGAMGGTSFPHSISKLFRVDNDIYSLVTNVQNNSITRLKFNGCTSSSIPSSSLQNPAPVVYNTPGTYNINLTTDVGLPTQSAFCRNVVVLPKYQHAPTKTFSMCSGDSVLLTSVYTSNNQWSTGSKANSIYAQTAGTYWVKTGYASCANMDTFIVTVKERPALNLGKDTSICSGTSIQLNAQTSGNGVITWYPSTYLSNASILNPVATPASTITYRAELLNQNGCISKDTITITVLQKPSINIRQDTSICPGTSVVLTTQISNAVSYSWSPVEGLSNPLSAQPTATPASTTEYVLTASNGSCSASSKVTITVKPLPVLTLTKDTTICSGGQAQLLASGAQSYLWSPGQGLSAANIFNPVASPLQTTIYQVTATGANGCVKTGSVTVAVSPKPTFTIQTTSPLCYGAATGSVTIFPTGSNSLYQYNFNNKGYQSGNIFTNLAAGTYPISVRNTAGCVKDTSVTLSISPALCQTIEVTGPVKVCGPNDTVKYSILRPQNCSQSYSIAADNAIFDITAQTDTSFKVVFRKEGTASIRVFFTNACNVVADTITVTAKFSPRSVDLGTGITTCKDTTFTLNADPRFITYQWQDGSTSPSFKVTVPGTYRLIATNYCGEQFTGFFQYNRIIALPFEVKPKDTAACYGEKISVSASGGQLYAWQPSGKFDDPSGKATFARLDSVSSFSVHITDTVCHRDTLMTIPLKVFPKPGIRITKTNDVTCLLDSAQLVASGGISYKWSPAGYITTVSDSRITVKPVRSTTYFVEGKDSLGCTGKDSVMVQFLKIGNQTLFIPNIFTPNYDGRNDVFRPVLTGSSVAYVFCVYNRWGQLLFKTGKQGEGWNGTFNNVLQPNGAYVYTLTIDSQCGDKFERKGTFVLVR